MKLSWSLRVDEMRRGKAFNELYSFLRWQKCQLWASCNRQAYLPRFNDKPDVYLTWGRELLFNSHNLEGVVCNNDQPCLTDVPQH